MFSDAALRSTSLSNLRYTKLYCFLTATCSVVQIPSDFICNLRFRLLGGCSRRGWAGIAQSE